MVDEFERSVVDFLNDPLAKLIKTNIKRQIGGLQGSKEHMEGYQRAQFLVRSSKLTGLELKRLKHYIDSLSRNNKGEITDFAYNMIGGDALYSFLLREIERLRHQINKARENQEELGKTEKQDVKPSKPPKFEKITGMPRLHLNLAEELKRINSLTIY